jgi:hypothetical protein
METTILTLEQMEDPPVMIIEELDNTPAFLEKAKIEYVSQVHL